MPAKKQATLSKEQKKVVDTTLGVVDNKMQDVFNYLDSNSIIIESTNLDAVSDNFELQKKMIDSLFSWTLNIVKITGLNEGEEKLIDHDANMMKGFTTSGASIISSLKYP